MIPAAIVGSHTTGLGVIRALGTQGIPIIVYYYDKNDMGHVSKYVRSKFFVPHPEHYEDQFINKIISLAVDGERPILVPTDDSTLKSISKNKDVLDEYYRVACSGWEITQKVINKKYTYELAERERIALPNTHVLARRADLEECGQRIGFPCIVKPCQSHLYTEKFRKKMVKVHDQRQLQKIFTAANDAGIEIMLQEYIPGDDSTNVNYNSYYVNGEPVAEFTAQKVRMHPRNFGVPCVVKSRAVDEIIKPGRTLLQTLGYQGYSCVEFKLDHRDNRYKLMEVNGRHNRSTLLAVTCGINFPLIEYKHLIYGDLAKQSSCDDNVYWIDEVKDFVRLFLEPFNNVQSIRNYCEPYRSRNVYSIADRNDIKPIIKRLLNLASRCLPVPSNMKSIIEK